MYVSMEYGHWGITVSERIDQRDYAPVKTTFFAYPVSNPCGPQNSAKTEAEAIELCKSFGGEVKGPFFH